MSKDGIRVWRAYSIWPGKFISWEELETPEASKLPKLDSVHPTSSSKARFINVTARRQAKHKSQDNASDAPSTTAPDVTVDEQKLFFCPENGCVKSYQQLSSLHNHLDCEKHQFALEHETLYDIAMVKYATKLEEGASSAVHSLPLQESTDSTSENIGPSLPMGWALKSAKTYKRLSKKQKDYLLEIFNVGNTTGHKADPAVVSKSMRRARQTSCEPMFTIDEYLTSQQIASFFSRQTAKKKKADLSARYLSAIQLCTTAITSVPTL